MMYNLRFVEYYTILYCPAARSLVHCEDLGITSSGHMAKGNYVI